MAPLRSVYAITPYQGIAPQVDEGNKGMANHKD